MEQESAVDAHVLSVSAASLQWIYIIQEYLFNKYSQQIYKTLIYCISQIVSTQIQMRIDKYKDSCDTIVDDKAFLCPLIIHKNCLHIVIISFYERSFHISNPPQKFGIQCPNLSPLANLLNGKKRIVFFFFRIPQTTGRLSRMIFRGKKL